ncbi:ATD-dependent RNA helicase, partial [Pseudoloma neurophilia]
NTPLTTDNFAINPEILVIANTKEMVQQIHSEYQRFSKYLNLNILSFVGGIPIENDITTIKNNQNTRIVIGTAGRILHLIKNNHLNLSFLRIFIADEIDHLFSTNEHRWSVQQIFLKTPVQKQTMFFTATLNDDCKEKILLFLKNPFILQVDVLSNLTLHGLDQGYLNITNDKKDDKLIELIDNIPAISQCVIFLENNFKCKQLEKFLISQGLPSISITSEYSTEERMLRFNSFKSFNYRFLITTNLMARGIDIAEINLVINYDMPRDANTYLHRVGRAGRFETMGVAISFISSEEDIIVLNEVQERFDVSIKEIKLGHGTSV